MEYCSKFPCQIGIREEIYPTLAINVEDLKYVCELMTVVTFQCSVYVTRPSYCNEILH